MTISNILSPIMLFLDRFIMGAVISVTSVAYYATPYEMVTKLGIIPGSLVTALFLPLLIPIKAIQVSLFRFFQKASPLLLF